jgi:hypothetical protein
MIIVLQAAGVVAVLVGLVTIGVGIPVKEFSFGNTLILSGSVGLCTGLILLGLSVVALEFRTLARRLTVSAARAGADPRARAALPPFPAGAQPPAAAGDGGPPFTRNPSPPPLEPPIAPPAAPPWDEDGSRARPDAPPELNPAQAPAPPKQRRSLMFSSSMRKDRERAGTPQEPTAPEPRAAAPSQPGAGPEASEAPPASFEDAWPKSGRTRPSEVPPQRRPSRLAPAPVPAESAAGAPPERAAPASPEQAPAVTVLKSGVVDGMAYSLYSDGSIEAQMPEGMMRFASIDELRAHLDQRS